MQKAKSKLQHPDNHEVHEHMAR